MLAQRLRARIMLPRTDAHYSRPSAACSTQVQIAFAFGGKSWPISSDDMNLGTVAPGMCLGGIFDLSLGSNVGSGGGNPTWVVGDTFLVSLHRVVLVSERN